mmetsp:Transcript_24626/g.68665  ORF Transcript_24626/g.68665 Transcript_24626/m.68665 type:complete len:435 (+) Transcript_24626:98-1402(+)
MSTVLALLVISRVGLQQCEQHSPNSEKAGAGDDEQRGAAAADFDLAVIFLGILLAVENPAHGLDLRILRVDDLAQDDFERAVVRLHRILQIVAFQFIRIQQGLGHVHGVLVMRDHLVHEQGLRAAGRHARRHAGHHVAVHRVDAAAELFQGAVVAWYVADEAVGAFGMRQLEGVQVERAAVLVVVAHDVVLVRNHGLVLVLRDEDVVLQELDASGHELMDVTEVEDIAIESGGLRIHELDLEVTVAGPVGRRVEEERLVVVKAEVVLSHGHVGDGWDVAVLSDVVAVLEVHWRWAGGLGLQGAALVGGGWCRNAWLQLILLVMGSISEVRESERMVPVGAVGLHKLVHLAVLQADGWVWLASALVEDVVSQLSSEKIDLHIEDAFIASTLGAADAISADLGMGSSKGGGKKEEAACDELHGVRARVRMSVSEYG